MDPIHPAQRQLGYVKFFNTSKGYGFILPNDSENDSVDEVFVHHTAIICEKGFKSLLEGEEVEYDLIESTKGLQAANVTSPGGNPLNGNVCYTKTQRQPVTDLAPPYPVYEGNPIPGYYPYVMAYSSVPPPYTPVPPSTVMPCFPHVAPLLSPAQSPVSLPFPLIGPAPGSVPVYLNSKDTNISYIHPSLPSSYPRGDPVQYPSYHQYSSLPVSYASELPPPPISPIDTLDPSSS